MLAKSLKAFIILGFGALSAAAIAKEATVDARLPTVFEDVLRCRAVTDPAQRLACFDGTATKLADAIARKDLAVADREQVRKARRSLFGFSLPTLNLFGGGDDDSSDKEAQEITETIASARLDADGYYMVVLNDGAVWHQTGGTIAVAPRHGDIATIKRASLSSYFMRIGSQPAVRARRDR